MLRKPGKAWRSQRILRPPQVAKLKVVVRVGVVKRGRSAPEVEWNFLRTAESDLGTGP